MECDDGDMGSKCFLQQQECIIGLKFQWTLSNKANNPEKRRAPLEDARDVTLLFSTMILVPSELMNCDSFPLERGFRQATGSTSMHD